MSILETRLERCIPKGLSSDDYVNAGSPAGWSRLVRGGRAPIVVGVVLKGELPMFKGST